MGVRPGCSRRALRQLRPSRTVPPPRLVWWPLEQVRGYAFTHAGRGLQWGEIASPWPGLRMQRCHSQAYRRQRCNVRPRQPERTSVIGKRVARPQWPEWAQSGMTGAGPKAERLLRRTIPSETAVRYGSARPTLHAHGRSDRSECACKQMSNSCRIANVRMPTMVRAGLLALMAPVNADSSHGQRDRPLRAHVRHSAW
jgi:hypothetical protein